MSDEEISEAGRQARFAQWEKIGLDDIKHDLREGGHRFVGGPPQVTALAREWVRMKEEQAKNSPYGPPTYTRQTVISACNMLAALGHSGFDQFLLELGMPDGIADRTLGGLGARTAALAKYALNNPTEITERNLKIPYEIILRASALWQEGTVVNLGRGERDKGLSGNK